MRESQVHILIDGSNLYNQIFGLTYGVERNSHWQFDFSRFVRCVVGDKVLGDYSCIFMSRTPPGNHGYMTNDEKELLESLGICRKVSGLASHKAVCETCGKTKKFVYEQVADGAIITGLFTAAHRCQKGDSMVLVSGDGHFYNALNEIATTLGVPVQVCGFEGSSSAQYRREERFRFLFSESIPSEDVSSPQEDLRTPQDSSQGTVSRKWITSAYGNFFTQKTKRGRMIGPSLINTYRLRWDKPHRCFS